MQDILIIIQNHVHLAPYLIFGMLLLAGLNIPISEDIMIFTSAVLAREYPEYKIQLFFGVYLGAYLSDLISFSLGWYLGPKVLKIKLFQSMVSENLREKISGYYEKYGVATLVFGRFIPFGVRNGLFLTAGLGKMPPIKFALSDLVACTVSTTAFFLLYFNFGKEMIDYVRKGNLIIFSLAIVVVLFFIIKRKKKSAV